MTFAGLLDTVASVLDVSELDFSISNQKTGEARLWLDPERVAHAVHITADIKTEYRQNFSLNHLNNTSEDGNFKEISVPGAHSDIGGGYFSSLLFDSPDYLLPTLERKCIKTITRNFKHSRDKEQAERYIKQALSEHQSNEINLGWGPSNFTTELSTRKVGKSSTSTGKLFYQRKVNGELSRLYLRLMYGLAHKKGVPFNDEDGKIWTKKTAEQYIVPENIGSLAYAAYCAKILSDAKEGKVDKIQRDIQEHDLMGIFMDLNLIHHSADNGIVNAPQDKRKRETYPCAKGD